MTGYNTGRVNAEVLNALTDKYTRFIEIYTRVERALPAVTVFEVRDSLRSMLDSEGIGTELNRIEGWRKRVDVMPEDTENIAPLTTATDARVFREMSNDIYADLQNGRITTDQALARGRAELASVPLTFTLTITLGNEGMQSDLDIAEALRAVADTLSESDDSPSNPTTGAEVIRDINGNTCGSWGVK